MKENMVNIGVVMASIFGDVALNGTPPRDFNETLDHVVVIIGRAIAAERAQNSVCDAEWEQYVTGIEGRLRKLDNELETMICQDSTSVSQ